MANHWSDDGDLVIEERTLFRPVGWLVNGGKNDGLLIANISEAVKKVPHGSFTPLYIQIGD